MGSVAPRRRVAFMAAFLLLATGVLPVLSATRGVALPAPARVTLSPNPAFLPNRAGATTPITATVLDSSTPPKAVSGQTIVWTSNGGVGFSPQTSTTDASGQATTTLKNINGTTGSQQVTAQAGTASGAATLYEYGPPAHLSLTLTPPGIPANGTATSQAVVRVTDAGSDPNPVANVALATNGDVTISPVTNRGDGTYAATITASTTADTETITATESTSSLSTTAPLTETTPSVLNGVFYNTATATSPSSWLPPIQDMEAWQGKGNAILNFYSGGLVDNTVLTQTLTAIWNQDHAVPLVSWVGAYNNQQALVAQGGLDVNIDATATALKTFVEGPDGVLGTADDRRLYFRYDWEANGDWYEYSPNYNPNHGNPSLPQVHPNAAEYQQNVANFKAAWAHTHDRFALKGLDSNHVAWVFSMADVDSYRANNASANPPDWSAHRIAEDIYPGDAYVDWLGIDGYNWGSAHPSGWRTPDQVFDPMMNRLRTMAPTKPIGVNEVGCGCPTDSVSQKAQWITDYFAWLHGNGAPMKMSLWFNTTSGDDFHVFGGADGDSTYTGASRTYNVYSTYGSAVRSNSWVKASDPSNPRLLTDAQFLGY